MLISVSSCPNILIVHGLVVATRSRTTFDSRRLALEKALFRNNFIRSESGTGVPRTTDNCRKEQNDYGGTPHGYPEERRKDENTKTCLQTSQYMRLQQLADNLYSGL
jgi:hypothetical protein